MDKLPLPLEVRVTLVSKLVLNACGRHTVNIPIGDEKTEEGIKLVRLVKHNVSHPTTSLLQIK